MKLLIVEDEYFIASDLKRVLEYLMRNKDTAVTKAELLQNVWDTHYDGPDNVVEVYVGYLRRKIDAPFGTNTIETVRGVGYRLTTA